MNGKLMGLSGLAASPAILSGGSTEDAIRNREQIDFPSVAAQWGLDFLHRPSQNTANFDKFVTPLSKHPRLQFL